MEYKASLDLTSKIITGVITVLFLGISSFNLLLIINESNDWINVAANIGSTALIIIIYIFCYIFRPISYLVEPNMIIIKRPLKNYKLDLDKVKNVSLTNKESMKRTMRVFGNGGLFGYYGKFMNKTFGKMTWFATRRNNYLIIETTDNKKIVLTPDDTNMIKEIKKLIRKK